MGANFVTVASVEISTDQFINGKRVASTGRFADISPVDGSHLADISAGGKVEANAAVEAARKAFPAWAALGPKGRLPILKKFAEGILARANELAAVESMTMAHSSWAMFIVSSRARPTTSIFLLNGH